MTDSPETADQPMFVFQIVLNPDQPDLVYVVAPTMQKALGLFEAQHVYPLAVQQLGRAWFAL